MEIIDLKRRISDLLLSEWDPLGVHFLTSKNFDEYDKQADDILLIISNPEADRDQVLSYLDSASYGFSRSWDDTEALERTTDLIWALRKNSLMNE